MNNIDMKTLDKITEAVFKKMAGIPFGNSTFQNECLSINAQITPARALRAVGLRMSDRLLALQEASFNFQKNLIDVEELEDSLASVELSKFDRQRKELELLKKKSGKKYLEKLVADAAFEVDCLTKILEKFPDYTREQFEAEEKNHFTKRMLLQAQNVTGPQEALFCMGGFGEDQEKKLVNDSGYIKVLDLITKKIAEKTES